MKIAKFNVAEAKRQLSDLLGRVAYGGETILITKRGRPMARLVPVNEEPMPHLADAVGWLEDDDPFFETMDSLSTRRSAEMVRLPDFGDESGSP